MNPLEHVTEHVLMRADSMQIICFNTWLCLRLVSRAMRRRFHAAAVPALLAYIRATAIAYLRSCCSIDPISSARVALGGPLVTACVEGRIDPVRPVCSTPWYYELNIHVEAVSADVRTDLSIQPGCFSIVDRYSSLYGYAVQRLRENRYGDGVSIYHVSSNGGSDDSVNGGDGVIHVARSQWLWVCTLGHSIWSYTGPTC